MRKNHIWLPLIISLCISAGFLLATWTGSPFHNGINSTAQTNKLSAILSLIEQDYAEEVNIDSLTEALIPLLLEQLDPHSSYIPLEDFNEVNDPLQGSFEGIGVEFSIQNDTITVMRVIAGGPSERVKIRAGDRIVTVNDSVVAGISITNSKVMKLLKGAKGSKVRVGIKRQGTAQLIDFEITRDKIPLNSIRASYMIDKEIAYLKLENFAFTTPKEFTEHIAQLRTQGMKKIIIDLRENGGGALNSAVFLANEFLAKGDLIVFTQGKNYAREDFRADGKGSCQDLGLAVLINEFSASASEVFAGAIQDNDRGIIVGRRSFGKGLVNRDFMLYDNSAVRLTIQKFYTPSGRCIQKPFADGIDAYNNDLEQRILHGELEHSDSISFPDSLQFKTRAGRIVHGGGGIMPDFFVPIDTTGYSSYLSLLENRGIIYDFAFSFADKHREQLSKIKTIEEVIAFCERENAYNQLLRFAEKKGIAVNKEQEQISRRIIKQRLHAYIVRSALGNESLFYKIINENDKTVLRAVEQLRTAKPSTKLMKN
ncbi:MAG: S41 family peptidase [Bacteroidetes bacterium]|nr:S41 family peptidase [Bacteroidota bacterium]